MPGFLGLARAGALARHPPGAAIANFGHTITHHHYTFTVESRARAQAASTGALFRWLAPREASDIPLSTTAKKALRLAGLL